MFRHHKKKNPFIYHLVTGMAMIILWRGLWGLFDVYLFPENQVLSYTLSVFIGLGILFINDWSISELSD